MQLKAIFVLQQQRNELLALLDRRQQMAQHVLHVQQTNFVKLVHPQHNVLLAGLRLDLSENA